MTPRRHRRWAAGLLAAAAVTVGGYSVTATGLLDGVTGGGGEQAASDAAGGDSSVSGAGPKAPEADAGDTASTALPSLSSQTIRRDAAELAREVAPAPPELRAESEGTSTQGFGTGATEDRTAPQPGGDPATAECRQPPGRIPGRRLSVTFDASAATAVVHPRDAGRVLVQVWSCDGPVLLARVLVPTVER
jgi:hypothetical protein